MLKCKHSEEAVVPHGRSLATENRQHHHDPLADFSEPSDTVYILPKSQSVPTDMPGMPKEILIARSPPLHYSYLCSQLT